MDRDVVDAQRREAFERIVGEVVEPLRRYLARRTDPATAEDVLADVLLVLWRRLDAIPPAVLPYAYGVAHNCLANAERSTRRQERLAAKIAAVDPPAEAVPSYEVPDPRVATALAALKPAEAELLRLWAWEELAPREIATVLDITANAASIRLHRAREKLKNALRKEPTDDGHEQVKGARDE